MGWSVWSAAEARPTTSQSAEKLGSTIIGVSSTTIEGRFRRSRNWLLALPSIPRRIVAMFIRIAPVGCEGGDANRRDGGQSMGAIIDSHVEWSVVSRLREVLDRPPDAEHDVTLTYALFTSTLYWTCERLRETTVAGRHQDLWSELGREIAVQSPWNIDQLEPKAIAARSPDLGTLPARCLLVGLRNGIAHGDHRTVLPLPF
jgi:hypothetical protein